MADASTNCEAMTRRDCLQLGLGALLGGGLVDALRAPRAEAAARPSTQADELHPDLDGRRADPLRDVRPQAGRARGDPRRVQADRHRTSRASTSPST